MATSDGVLETLERRSATVFLVAGGLLAVFAVNTGLRTFVGQSSPLVQSLVAPVGFLVGVLGLLGLYPAVANRTPTSARAAGVLAGVTAAYWIVIVAGSLGDIVGVLPASEELFPLVFFFGVYVAMLLTYAVFGIVALRAGVPSRTVGLLVLGPAAMFLLLMTGVAPNFLIDAGHALFHFGIGIALRAESVPTERAGPAPDSTA